MSELVTTKKKPTVIESLLDDFEEKLKKRSDNFIKCANCKHVLTHEDTAISVGGTHRHVKTNPFGLTFEFRCYSEALGCAISGPDESAHSWFPGCVWQYLHCEACNQHLGWFFHGSESFYGMRSDAICIE
ncbi:MAG: hypothetical protein F4W90_00480 [Gammaproteobacteria bacterium]|nr:hypothetical protein [Gammaproteobacteria bacterium]